MRTTLAGNMAVLAVLLLGTCSTSGVPTVGSLENWNSGLNNWQFAVGTPPGGGAQSTGVGAIGGHASAITMLFGDQSGGLGFYVPEDERVFANNLASGGLFAGDQNYAATSVGVAFSFYAQDYTTPADTLALFFTGGSGRTWKYSIAGPAATGVWTSYGVPMVWNTGWTSPGFGQAEFMADLADVDVIGVWVSRSSDLGPQSYGIDDFSLYVPEPATYVILAFTLLTLALTLRRKEPVLVHVAGNR